MHATPRSVLQMVLSLAQSCKSLQRASVPNVVEIRVSAWKSPVRRLRSVMGVRRETRQAARMLRWPHPGFHVRTAVWVFENDRAFATRLARCCARNPVALERLAYDRTTKSVTQSRIRASARTAGRTDRETHRRGRDRANARSPMRTRPAATAILSAPRCNSLFRISTTSHQMTPSVSLGVVAALFASFTGAPVKGSRAHNHPTTGRARS